MQLKVCSDEPQIGSALDIIMKAKGKLSLGNRSRYKWATYHIVKRQIVVDKENIRPPIIVAWLHVRVGQLFMKQWTFTGFLEDNTQANDGNHRRDQIEPSKEYVGKKVWCPLRFRQNVVGHEKATKK